MTTKATVTIQIGNTDDKLSQVQWANFVGEVNFLTRKFDTHFGAASAGDARWQNYCLVCAVPLEQLEKLKTELTAIRRRYEQESAAFTVGETFFV